MTIISLNYLEGEFYKFLLIDNKLQFYTIFEYLSINVWLNSTSSKESKNKKEEKRPRTKFQASPLLNRIRGQIHKSRPLHHFLPRTTSRPQKNPEKPPIFKNFSNAPPIRRLKSLQSTKIKQYNRLYTAQQTWQS